MNCIQSFIDHAHQFPEQPALWNQGEGVTNFGQIYNYAVETQHLANSYKVQKGDYTLIFGNPSASLYSAVIGLLGLGCSVIFIEPWMSISEIEQIIAATSPKLYITTFLGRFWGMRVKAIRKIPAWVSLHRKKKTTVPQKLLAEDLLEEHIGFITFTTGTTGRSKGVIRTHGDLYNQCKVLSKYLTDQEGPDLCVLPNFVLLNMALGKSSVFVSSICSRRDFQKIPELLKPRSVSCGPGFLKKLIENADCFSELASFHIGGALAECSLYETGIEKWPKAKWVQIYGSSEAEPVAIADIREVLKHCKERSLHQTLYLGYPISELKIYFENDLLWVSGKHVSPSYAKNPRADKTNKKIDAQHRVWHQRFSRTKIFGVVRQLFRAIGRHLVQLNVLQSHSDIFYLTVEEIFGYIEGRSVNLNLSEIATRRRAEFDQFKNSKPPPDRLLTMGPVGFSLTNAQLLSCYHLDGDSFVDIEEPNTLRGTACSPGIIEGTVRVVRDLKDARGLKGEILVTERTDPGWVPLYPSCSGLLIERGSLLSHSAIVARELGLPTVVGITGGLMQKLQTGMKVKIDGTKGTVTILG